MKTYTRGKDICKALQWTDKDSELKAISDGFKGTITVNLDSGELQITNPNGGHVNVPKGDYVLKQGVLYNAAQGIHFEDEWTLQK